MIKSKFVTEKNILNEKLDKYRIIDNSFPNLYLFVFKRRLTIEMTGVREFFVDRNKTLINCNISKSKHCDALVEEYFYLVKGTDEIISFSTELNEHLGTPQFPKESKEIEITFEGQNIFLNILIDNAVLIDK